MELHICHLYPSLLNMYGDVGNVKILKRRAGVRDIDVHVHEISTMDDFSGETYDIVMLGGGQDFEMQIVMQDVEGTKKEKLRDYIENDGVFLAVGSGFQMLGDAYVTGTGKEAKGLSLLPFSTKPHDKRFVGNIAIRIGNDIAVGFENHAGRTEIGTLSPLGKVLSGFGNNGDDGKEGVLYKNTACTFLHGPFLAKSPEFADVLLLKALQKRYGIESLSLLDDTFEQRAKEDILQKLNITV